MTIDDRKLWSEGKQLWNEYVFINGYNFYFSNEGIAKLSRILDLTPSYIKKRISFYLDN